MLINFISQFSDIKISQGNEATHFRWGEIFCDCFTANFHRSMPVRESWKSVSIWWRCDKNLVASFFWLVV